MTRAARVTLVIACVVAASTACATGNVGHWSRVERLKVGSSIRVLTDDAPFVERRLVSADRSTLVVEADDGSPAERVAADRVLMITKTEPRHPVRRGAIIGGIVGAFQGSLATQGLSCSDCTGQALAVMWPAIALDAGLGALMMRGEPPYEVIYRRP